MAVNAADAWQQSGPRPDRPSRSPGADRPVERGMATERPSRPRPVPPRERPVERGRSPERPERSRPVEYYDQAPPHPRPPVPSRQDPARPSARSADRPGDHGYDDERWAGPEVERRGSTARPGRRPAPAAASGSRLRGIFAVLGIFVLTLAACGADSVIGVGPGTITLIGLVAATAIATFVVRRRDLLTVVVSPPLIFVAVVVVKIVATPALPLSLKTFVPLLGLNLVSGFPTMAVGVGAAIVVALIRLAARR
jgi:uncharacterized protein DUF6542